MYFLSANYRAKVINVSQDIAQVPPSFQSVHCHRCLNVLALACINACTYFSFLRLVFSFFLLYP